MGICYHHVSAIQRFSNGSTNWHKFSNIYLLVQNTLQSVKAMQRLGWCHSLPFEHYKACAPRRSVVVPNLKCQFEVVVYTSNTDLESPTRKEPIARFCRNKGCFFIMFRKKSRESLFCSKINNLFNLKERSVKTFLRQFLNLFKLFKPLFGIDISVKNSTNYLR